MKDDREYLLDLLERIQRIETFTQGGREEFSQSILIQDGVIRNFEVMGEIVKRLCLTPNSRISRTLWRSPFRVGNSCRFSPCPDSRLALLPLGKLTTGFSW